MPGFITEDGANYLLALLGANEPVVPTYYVALTHSIPTPYMSADDLDEPDVAEYARAIIINDGTAWARSVQTLANALPITWPTASVSWGDVLGWALLDSPIGGRIIYGGDLGVVMTIDATHQPSMTAGQLAISIAVSDWALEI